MVGAPPAQSPAFRLRAKQAREKGKGRRMSKTIMSLLPLSHNMPNYKGGKTKSSTYSSVVSYSSLFSLGTRRSRFSLFTIHLSLFLLLPFPALSQESMPRNVDESLTVRVKDVAKIEGVRDNQLLGYGLVIGLNRTGDRVQQNLYARQSLQNLLERMGISTRPDTLQPENMATVMVTATLPAFVRPGSKIDVTVSSIGDARSLQGGTLILSTLKGVDGQVYAIAQVSVSIVGIAAGNRRNSVEVNHPTAGRGPNAATAHPAVPVDFTAPSPL